eukprot:m.142579 g.142579  ORF g.142579 m.142579 type:complete len:274 (+) comp14880_c0_seq2:136-957(+)
MAANFWKSSQRQEWMADRDEIKKAQQRDINVLSVEEQNHLKLFYLNVIQLLGGKLAVKQQIIATASIYFKRFYLRNSWTSIEPYLLAISCVYLGTKVEEYGPISARKVLDKAKQVATEHGDPLIADYKQAQIVECEFILLESLDCSLVIYHAYRPLMNFVEDAKLDKDFVSLAWRIVNDSLRSDLCFLYPPYLIAIGCLHFASIVKNQDLSVWLGGLNICTEEIMEVTQILLDTYNLMKHYQPRAIQGICNKLKMFVKNKDHAAGNYRRSIGR